MVDQIGHCPYCGKSYIGRGFHSYCGIKCAKEAEGDEWVAKKKKQDEKVGNIALIFVAIFVVVMGLSILIESGII